MHAKSGLVWFKSKQNCNNKNNYYNNKLSINIIFKLLHSKMESFHKRNGKKFIRSKLKKVQNKLKILKVKFVFKQGKELDPTILNEKIFIKAELPFITSKKAYSTGSKG